VRNHLTESTPNERIWGLQYHPENFLIAGIGGNKGQLVFWNETEEKPFHVFSLPNSVRGLALDTDGLRVATTHHDKKLRITKLGAKA
jgi:hypothetical protein